MIVLHFIALLLFSFNRLTAAVDWDVVTPLDEYVFAEDGAYSWEEVASYNYDGVTVYVLNVTTQRYMTEEFSTRPFWWHYVGVSIPDDLRNSEHAGMLIDGGGTNFNAPGRDDLANTGIAAFSRATGYIGSYIRSIPNQPIMFYNDPSAQYRTEDTLIAWTWRSYWDMPEPKDQRVIIRMPMTKSVKRALDTVTAVTKQRLPDSNVEKFIILGASKRGWTTWSIAAVDRRVVAIVPIVFSLINMDVALMTHNRNMGQNWSFALNPYWRENLTQEFLNPMRQEVWEVEDMWTFKERFTIPIYAMSATGDEFFIPDDNHAWWDAMPEPKHLMMLANAEHTMAPHYLKIAESVLSFVTRFIEGDPMPTVTWTMSNTTTGGYIRMFADPPPESIRAWRAETLPTDDRRDFRLVEGQPDNLSPHLVVWYNRTLEVEDLGNGEYYVEAENVEGEWVGFFIEGIWRTQVQGANLRMFLTSQVNIIPYTHPAEACTDAESCWGKLV